VVTRSLRWHVQEFGSSASDRPSLLLLHGTGASTHSWRDLAPALLKTFRVIAPDLPGHGFTDLPETDRLSLPGMGEAILELLAALGETPAAVVGHSAGAAIGAWLTTTGGMRPDLLVGLNGAWLPFGGPAAPWLAPATRWLAGSGTAARLFSGFASSPVVLDRLLAGTGSVIDAAGRRGYATLVSSPGHVAAALGMMARWDLRTLVPDLTRTLPPAATRLLLIVGSRDLTVPPSQSVELARRMTGVQLESLAGLGHLAHEERPDLVAERILASFAALRQTPRSG
jgi:magnesium chelatase accessory protein